MAISDFLSRLISQPEEPLASSTIEEQVIENAEIREEIEVQDEEVDTAIEQLNMAIQAQSGEKTSLKQNILEVFENINNLSLDAWAKSTLKAYQGYSLKAYLKERNNVF